MPYVVQADALDPGPVDELVEPVDDGVGVHRPPVRVADEPPRIAVAVSERLLFGVQHGQVAAQVGDGSGSRDIVRRPLSVLPSDSSALPPTTTRVSPISSVALSRSSSFRSAPANSERRIPVAAARTYIPASRSVTATASHAASSSDVHVGAALADSLAASPGQCRVFGRVVVGRCTATPQGGHAALDDR